jgi:FKBP-type peptidyl-prolyl cis-trans isomerase
MQMVRITKMKGLAFAAFLLTACTDDTPTDPAQLTFAPGLNVNLSAMTRTSSGLYIQDEVVGTGAQVVRGNTVTVDYTGWLHNGTQFDTSSGRSPIEVTNIGSANVIAGWNEGLIGMRVGGRRLLVIPPRLAYGADGRSPSIPGHATLVFRVDMRGVR